MELTLVLFACCNVYRRCSFYLQFAANKYWLIHDLLTDWWYCLRAEHGLYICWTSVRPSVCLSQHGPWQQTPQHSSKVCCCGPADRRYQSIAARRTERRRAAAECGQCCVVNWTQTYYFTHWLSCLARSLLTFIHRDEDAVNEIQPSVDADYYRRAVQFTEDVFVFSGPQKTCTYLRHVTLKLYMPLRLRVAYTWSWSCLQCFDTVGWASGRASAL